jgi:hypothetical protein
MRRRRAAAAESRFAALTDGILADALRDFAIYEAKIRVAAAVVATTLANLTDSSGGAAADGTLNAIPVPAAGFTEAATASAQKAGFETALGTVKNAITELAAKVVALKAIVPATDLANNVGGTAANGTIDAITVTLTAVNTSIVSFATGSVVMKNVRNYLYTLAIEVNKLCVALGVTPVVIAQGEWSAVATPLAALSTDTGTAVDGTAASGVSKAAGDAFLAACAAATKELATKINALHAVTNPVAVPFVAAA